MRWGELRYSCWFFLLLLVLGLPPVQSNQASVDWFLFNPFVVLSNYAAQVEYRVKISGNPSNVQLELASGQMVGLTSISVERKNRILHL
jgi:hypothetical protein